MGVVYLAYDPQLDRKVAIKFLRPGSEGDRGQIRLLREAQALAKLNHPNVVAVHDVSTLEERVWLAMEFVEGQTLRDWATSASRSWIEVLEVMIEAGRGLAAAHTAGLLHRDFKPDNVMIDVNGRVKVMDFGLARAWETSSHLPPLAEKDRPVLAVAVTRDDALIGTPAYMAPEQFRGNEVSAAADQFSFCITLWELLFGQSPFSTERTYLECRYADAWTLPAPPRGRRVPAWVHRACARGLRYKPESRWPSLTKLLDVLQRVRSRARAKRWALGVAGLLTLVASGEGYRRVALARATEACEGEGETIRELWNADARAAARAGMVATGLSYAAMSADKTMPWIERYANKWSEVRTQACLEATVYESMTTQAHERARWCLDERRQMLAAHLDQLNAADNRVVERAVITTAGLPSLDLCVNPAVLESLPAPAAAEVRDAVMLVRADLSNVVALDFAGQYERALELAEGATQRAEELAWPPAHASALKLQGWTLRRLGRYAESEKLQSAAFVIAMKTRSWRLAASCANNLANTVGYHEARHTEGHLWIELGEATASLAGDPDHMLEASRVGSLAAIVKSEGDMKRASELYERKLAIESETMGEGNPRLATTLKNIADIRREQGDNDEAVELYRRAETIWRDTLGEEHPHMAVLYNSLAVTFKQAGEYDKVEKLFERALAIRERALGPEHSYVAAVVNNLADFNLVFGNAKKAKELNERALAIWTKVHGGDHPYIGFSLFNLALSHEALGELDEAITLHNKSLELFKNKYGDKHANVAKVLGGLANAHQVSGDYDTAIALHKQAIEIYEEVAGAQSRMVAINLSNLGNDYRLAGKLSAAEEAYRRSLGVWETVEPENPQIGFPLTGLTNVLIERGEPSKAVSHAERGLSIRERRGAPEHLIAESRYGLARAKWNAGQDRVGALDLAREAAAAYRETEATNMLPEIEAWIAEHEGAAP